MCAQMGRRKATIGDAGICDDPSGLTGVLSFQVPYEAHPWGGPRMLAKVRELRPPASLASQVEGFGQAT